MNCRMTCPRIVADLKRLDREIKGSRKGLRFLLFLFDDARKKPAAVRAFTARYKITEPHWRVLTAAPDSLKRLTSKLGVRFNQDKRNKYAYIHTNYFAIIAASGALKREIRGLQPDNARFVAQVQESLQ